MSKLDKLFPTVSETTQKYLSNARNLSKEEALKILLSTPEFLDPVLFVLFTSDSSINEVISFKKYALYMQDKAVKSRNKNLLEAANEALEIYERTRL
jgi:phosphatidylinositol kinase/protein kinase (PI-3  family)